MIGTLTFENVSGDIRIARITGESMEAIDNDARMIVDFYDGSFVSLTF